MKTKKLALISFFIPFIFGGGIQSIGIVLDRWFKPDTDEWKILLGGLLDWIYCGSILGIISVVLVLGIAALLKFTASQFRKMSKK